jgi:hypothetical protein
MVDEASVINIGSLLLVDNNGAFFNDEIEVER